MEYTGGRLDVARNLPMFCAAASGGRDAHDPGSPVDPNAWEAAPDGGSCADVAARAAPLLCAGGPPGHQLFVRALHYDTADGMFTTATAMMGPRCP